MSDTSSTKALSLPQSPVAEGAPIFLGDGPLTSLTTAPPHPFAKKQSSRRSSHASVHSDPFGTKVSETGKSPLSPHLNPPPVHPLRDPVMEMRSAAMKCGVAHRGTASLDEPCPPLAPDLAKIKELDVTDARDLLETLVTALCKPSVEEYLAGTTPSNQPVSPTPSDMSVKSGTLRYVLQHQGLLRHESHTQDVVLDNRYVLLHDLGSGSQGVVRLWHDETEGVQRVIKEIKQPNSCGELSGVANAVMSKRREKEAYDRLQNEVAIMKRARHPNIIRCYEVIEAENLDGDNCLHFVLQHAKKGAIAEVSQDLSCDTRDPDEFIPLARQIAEGLAYIHSLHVVHRDIKPENILEGADGEAFVADFGVSQIQFAEDLNKEACTTHTNSGSFGEEDESPPQPEFTNSPPGEDPPAKKEQVWQDRSRDPTTNPVAIKGSVGTHEFLAPEIVRDSVCDDGFAADVWALGVTFCLILTGKFPFAHAMSDEWKNTNNKKRMEFAKELHRCAERKETPFGADCSLGESWRELISAMVAFDAKARPAMHKINQLLKGEKFGTPEATSKDEKANAIRRGKSVKRRLHPSPDSTSIRPAVSSAQPSPRFPDAPQ